MAACRKHTLLQPQTEFWKFYRISMGIACPQRSGETLRTPALVRRICGVRAAALVLLFASAVPMPFIPRLQANAQEMPAQPSSEWKDLVEVETERGSLFIPRSYFRFPVDGPKETFADAILRVTFPDLRSAWIIDDAPDAIPKLVPLDNAIQMRTFSVSLLERFHPDWATDDVPSELDPKAGLISYVERVVPGTTHTDTDIFYRVEGKNVTLHIRCHPFTGKGLPFCDVAFEEDGIRWSATITRRNLQGRVQDVEARLRQLVRLFATAGRTR